jgi:hypothetical protein
MKALEVSYQCNYFQQKAFPDRVSGLHLLHEQLTGIDNHICNLQMTQSELLYGVNQLCLPASIIPTEVLAYIFCQLGGPGFILPTSEHRYNYVCQSVILTSASHYWHQVALETPELWQKIDIDVHANNHSVVSASSAI